MFGSREIVSGKFDYDEKVQYIIYGNNKGAIMIRELLVRFSRCTVVSGGLGGANRLDPGVRSRIGCWDWVLFLRGLC